MQAVHADALGSVNTYITTAKRDRALYEARFSMITFNSESVDTIRQNEIVEEVKPIGSEEYVCTRSPTPWVAVLASLIGRSVTSRVRPSW
jgi:hypothetical protein